MKRVFPVRAVPVDADGVVLQEGDRIVSTEDYDGPIRHTGKIVRIAKGGLIEHQHDEVCCGDRKVWRCASFLWRKAP
jgi:hypothetical protein